MVRHPESSRWLKQAGLLTAIPFVLLTGPALGYYLGASLDHRWSHAPWGMLIGVVLGLVSGMQVTADLIRQARELDDDERRKTL